MKKKKETMFIIFFLFEEFASLAPSGQYVNSLLHRKIMLVVHNRLYT